MNLRARTGHASSLRPRSQDHQLRDRRAAAGGRPLPNQLHKSPNMKYPFVEHLLWYPMLILGLVGLWVIVKRRKTASIELVYTIFVIGGLAVMWGLVEGNFGTAYRHRGELVWGIAVLDGIGIDYLLGRRQPGPTAIDKQ